MQPHELLGQLIVDIVVKNPAIPGAPSATHPPDVLDQNAISNGDKEEREESLSSPEQSLPALECLVKFLGVWTTKFPYDFRDERIMSHVKHIVAK